MTVEPGSMTSVTNRSIDGLPASGSGASRHRPNPFGSSSSTTTATGTRFSEPRPAFPPTDTPPMNVSSTSTLPDSLGRSLRTIATRKRCSIAHAVLYDTPSVRSSVRADIPFFAVTTSKAAENQVVNGVLVCSKIVPARSDRFARQWRQMSRLELDHQGSSTVPHASQT